MYIHVPPLAWAAYYQQLQAYAQQQQQGGGGGAGAVPQGAGQQGTAKASLHLFTYLQLGGPPASGAAGSNDLQSQWAEYYRQMYYYQQQQQQQGAGGGPPPGQGGPPPQSGGMPPRN